MSPEPPRYVVRRVRAEEWPALRALRLQALRDPVAHLAFLETEADAAARPDAFWQDRTRAAASSTSVAQFIAVAPGDGAGDDSLAGTVTTLLTAAGEKDYLGETSPALSAAVVGVYVPPAHRGGPVLGLLFDAVEDWLRGLGLARVRLHVHEHNVSAAAAYRKRGYVASGNRVELLGGVELEMVRELS